MEKILIIDYGSDWAQELAKQVRELGVFSEIAPGHGEMPTLDEPKLKGIILVGQIPQELPELLKGETRPVWALGESSVKEAELVKFLTETCACIRDWDLDMYLKQTIETIRKQVGKGQVVCGLSGGIDSSVVAVLVHKAIGDQLTCIYVDHGFMRAGESEQVVKTFQEQYQIPLVHVQAQKRFLTKLAGVEDPEQKRKIIGTEFIRVFEDEAAKIGQVDYLAQGTLYPDVIESGATDDVLIKSHHNVGGLPEDLEFELIEPLAVLFKDEVRLLAQKLGLPEEIVKRHPFPGPGLAIRIIGAVEQEKLEILRAADAIAIEEIRKAGWYDQIWQALVVLTNTRTVGVYQGERTYDYVVALRFVSNSDGMTADWTRVPHELLDTISQRLMTEIRGINRVVYDVSSKPPATIEWE